MEKAHVIKTVGKTVKGFRAGNLTEAKCDWIVLLFEDGSELSLSGYSEPIEIEFTEGPGNAAL